MNKPVKYSHVLFIAIVAFILYNVYSLIHQSYVSAVDTAMSRGYDAGYDTGYDHGMNNGKALCQTFKSVSKGSMGGQGGWAGKIIQVSY